MDSEGITEERQLIPHWSPELIALSYCISWLGAYTSTQIIIHAKYTNNAALKWLWTLLASVAFGFSAIWSMHFVGMLACRLDVDITFNLPATILSAFSAVFFTFAAITSAYTTKTFETRAPFVFLYRWTRPLRTFFSRLRCRGFISDIESGGYIPIRTSSSSMDAPTQSRLRSSEEDENGEVSDAGPEMSLSPEAALPFSPNELNHGTILERVNLPPSGSIPSKSSVAANGLLPAPPRQGSSSRLAEPRRSMEDEASGRDSLSTDGSSSESLFGRFQSSSTFNSNHFSESLRAGLSREARLRIRAHALDKPVPHFGWRYWVKAHYETISVLVTIRAAIWAAAIAFMHYCGMWAMEIPEGRISWDLRIVAVSYIVALAVCFVGCIAMTQMELNFWRQVAFSTTVSAGCCSMHYTGMAAATFYSRAPPSPHPMYPAYLPFAIVGIAVFVCVVSNTILSHSAINSRNRMAEMILTKRRLWRIMAEKEAAEQANELKQQFISVASHEIRTPMHAVNGYCELLALTSLTEEQSLYVTSIQQACHAINVIAGNVLDFSKLDRNNVELTARPVLVDLRKMVENLARITDVRRGQPGQPGVDMIVSVSPSVPHSVYLDETYTFRVIMNLLSNAQKFCDSGYICLSIRMDATDQIVIEVSDTGCGIPACFRSSLFQPYRQADMSTTRSRQGTGLGLSIVKQLLERMNGTIEVASTEGEGSTFTVRLPITVPTDIPPTLASPPLVQEHIKLVYVREGVARCIANMWENFGFTVSIGSIEASTSELIEDADVLWSDVESVRASSALRGLLCSSKYRPPMYIVHSDTSELMGLEPLISSARGVVLVKRPLVLHNVLGLLLHPEPHLTSGHAKVRFALPEDSGMPITMRGNHEDVEPAINDTPFQLLPPTHGRRKGKILLVEDNIINQHLGQRLLEKLGYHVDTARDGQEAVSKVQQTSFVCCLMDCQMPVLDGFTATSKIRELESKGTIHGRLPIIALTANVSNENEDRCRAAGMDKFLSKPLNLSELQSCIDQFSTLATSS